MWFESLRRSFQSMHQRKLRGSPRRPSTRLHLEHMEDRTVPTVGFGSALGVGGASQELAHDLATDSAGNRYITGSFASRDFNGDGLNDGVDFDPGPGVYRLYGNPTGISPFVAKYSPTGGLIWAWGAGPNGGGYGSGESIAVDGVGNVFATGSFGGTMDFDPTATHTSRTALTGDAFVLKLDSNGNFGWVDQVSSPGSDAGNGIAVDASGNVYTTGSMQDTTDLASNMHVLILKHNNAGTRLWQHQTTGVTNNAKGNGIALDVSGNVHVTGGFMGKVDFDPSTASTLLSSGGRNNTSMSAFVMKLTGGGQFVWARNFSTTSGFGGCQGNDIAVDAAGNVLTTGESHGGTNDFDPGTKTYKLSGHYVSKLNANGQFVWAKQLGGHGTDLTLDSLGNVYLAGYFQGTADFNPGAGTFQMTSAGGWDGFVTKLDTNGNFVWSAQMGGAGNDRITGIAINPDGNVLLTGYFELTADFDFLNSYGDNRDLLSSGGSHDFFQVLLLQS